MERAFEFNVCPAAPRTYKLGRKMFRNNVHSDADHYKPGFDEETNRATVIRPVTCSVQWGANEEYDLVESANQICESYSHQAFISIFPTLDQNRV